MGNRFVANLLIFVQLAFWAFFFFSLIFFLVRQIRNRKKEDFEDRDN